jgi:PBP1b-binding outer membrane lipoprotein LpoB
MKIITIIIFALATTGCAQLTGAAKANYQSKQCETHFKWDEQLQMNRVTHETCSYSTVSSNREFADGILIEGNRSTGEFKVDTASIKNADESSITQALGQLLGQPAMLQALIETLTKEQKE